MAANTKHRKNHKQKVNEFKLKRKDLLNKTKKAFLQQINELYKQKMEATDKTVE